MTWNRENPKPPSTAAASHAPRLRHFMTDAEKRMWTALRKELPKPDGTHFRRQMSIGSYVVDFVCLTRRVVVEVDGEIHDRSSSRRYDADRDRFLKSQAFKVLRFSNREIMLDMPSVLQRISAAFSAPTPPPDPSPQGGGERVVHP